MMNAMNGLSLGIPRNFQGTPTMGYEILKVEIPSIDNSLENTTVVLLVEIPSC